MRTLRAAAALLCLAAPAAADELRDFTEAFGELLGSEAFCGLSYDQAVIAALIDKNVPAGALKFPGNLRYETTITGYSIKEMSPSAKTAHCTAVTNPARAIKLIP